MAQQAFGKRKKARLILTEPGAFVMVGVQSLYTIKLKQKEPKKADFAFLGFVLKSILWYENNLVKDWWIIAESIEK